MRGRLKSKGGRYYVHLSPKLVSTELTCVDPGKLEAGAARFDVGWSRTTPGSNGFDKMVARLVCSKYLVDVG